MKVHILEKTYAFGEHHYPGEKKTLTEEQGQKLIDRNLAKEFKPKFETKELKAKKKTKNAPNKN